MDQLATRVSLMTSTLLICASTAMWLAHLQILP